MAASKGALLVTLLLTLVNSDDVCKVNGTCPIDDNHTSYLVLPESEDENLSSLPPMLEKSTVPSTEVTLTSAKVPEPVTSSTPATTKKVPKLLQKSPPTVVCWCDMTIGYCDINCCCDKECLLVQRQIFTHCSESKPVYDLKSCYSSNLFFRRPKVTDVIEDTGLFCVVRENLAHMKEFKRRTPIRSIEEFDRELKRKKFETFPVKATHHLFDGKAYKSGSVIWALRRGGVVPFDMPQPLSGDLCLSSKAVVFLNDVTTKCTVPPLQNSANTSKWLTDVIKNFVDLKLVTAPQLFNASDMLNSVKNCSSLKSCVATSSFLCKNHPSTDQCVKINSTSVFQRKDFQPSGAFVETIIYQNGSEGIISAETRLWSLPVPTLQISVKYLWANSTGNIFIRSGNPGYLQGRPILAGKKINHYSNDTSTVVEAIRLSYDPKGWLTTFNANNEKCSNIERQPILFNDRTISTCSFELNKRFFDKNGCLDLQKTILEHLLGENIVNVTSAEVNQYVGCYGNSKVEILSDWIQVIVDSFPLISSQVSFEKSVNGLWCKGITTSLNIDIAFSKFGSFTRPQSKIVGVLYRFGPRRNVYVRCYSKNCENSFFGNSIKLRVFVNFVDLSTAPVHLFAQPPGLEAKLPHDFFYPFFSGRGSNLSSIWWLIFAFCLII